MKKLHIFVIKSYLGPFIMTFFIALFILLMQFLWKYIDDLVGKGLQWYVIAQLLFYAASTFIPLALPLAVLLSSLMTFGNFGERYELVAMKSAGISLRQVMMPLAITALIISLVAFYFANNLLPVVNLKMRALLYDVREQKPAVNIKEGIFYNGIDNYVIRVGRKDKDGKTIYNIMIYDHTDRVGDNNLTIADWGKMEFTEDKRFLIFHLFNGTNYYEDLSTRKKEIRHPFQRTVFKEQYVRIDLSEFTLTRTNEEFFKGNYTMLNVHQLNVVCDSLYKSLNNSKNNFSKKFKRDYLTYYSIDSNKLSQHIEVKNNKFDVLANVKQKQKVSVIEMAIELSRRAKENIFFQNMDIVNRLKIIDKHLVEYHRKFTLSLACLICFLLGAQVGAIIRRGGFGLPVVMAVLFFVCYHVISIIGEKFSREGVMPAYAGMWLSTYFMLPIALFLTYKATSDSPILDAEIWNRVFRLLRLISKKAKVKS